MVSVPRQRRRSGSYSVGRARRDAILDTATAHFVVSGYHRTSMVQIAADVGLSEAGLLHHFPTKKHLLVAVAARRFTVAAQWATELDDASDPRSPLRRLVTITERFLTQPGLIELFVRVSAEAADPSSPAHELYVEQYRVVTGAIAAAFDPGVAAGRFRADLDYTAIAQQIIAMTDGLQLQWTIFGGEFDLVGRMRSYVDQLTRAIEVAPAPE